MPLLRRKVEAVALSSNGRSNSLSLRMPAI
jgi:hypothetical protein